MSESRLFSPLKVGNLVLKNRVAMAPLTRFRADDSHVPLPMVAEYYAQRASVPGTLLITEATFITPQAGGYANVPGIYNDAQIEAWRHVTDAVHRKGSFIYLQLWHLGRTANKEQAEKEGIVVRSSSAAQLSPKHAVPVPLSVPEIQQTVQDYAQAAKNAIVAGFDGVEIHGANGYLIDQFIQDKVNQRTDEYGGSIENRSRFAVEVAEAVVKAIGSKRTGIRLSPFNDFQGMRMKEPLPQFSDVVTKLNKLDLAYLHLVESSGHHRRPDIVDDATLEPLVKLFRNPVIIAGQQTPESARKLVDEKYADEDVVVGFGRYFISTPDLVFRLQKEIEFNPFDVGSFYTPKSAVGYTDYAFSKEFIGAKI